MRGRTICLSLFVLVLACLQPTFAEEITCKTVTVDRGADILAGKLVRVDKGSVTVARLKDQQIVKQILQVGNEVRHKAAPFIGKTVNVGFKANAGRLQAIFFSPCRASQDK